MRTVVRIRWGLLLAIVILLVLGTVVFLRNFEKPKQFVNPHEGQKFLYDGFDWIWMTPLEGVEPNSLTPDDFILRDGAPVYTGSKYQTLRGLDVSEHQLSVDWSQVAGADVDYAFIRIGRRGYSEGGLFEDPYFRANIEGAQRIGLKVGVYFFSQAINVQEAFEEADFVIERLRSYQIELPVVFDWEHIEGVGDARTNDLDVSTRTDCAVAFCEAVKNAGYRPAVYFNRRVGYYGYDLTRLKNYDFWFALPESIFPNFYYAVDIWQYSFSETIPGFHDSVDMNLMFLPK